MTDSLLRLVHCQD